jgi:hypothetical protein
MAFFIYPHFEYDTVLLHTLTDVSISIRLSAAFPYVIMKCT